MTEQEIPQYMRRHEVPIESFYNRDKKQHVEYVFTRQLPEDKTFLWGLDRKRGIAYIYEAPSIYLDPAEEHSLLAGVNRLAR